MWRLLFAWALLSGGGVLGQPLRRNTGESAEAFARRHQPGPGAMLTGNVLETGAWDNHTRVIIAFYAREGTRPAGGRRPAGPCLAGYVFVPVKSGGYRRLFIDCYEQEGADAEIASVFFVNADHDSARELAVLCQWPQQHYQVSGMLYGVRFYDNPAPASTNLVPLPAVDKLFPAEFDGRNEQGENKAAYKTAGAVRQKLRQLGY